MRSTVIMMMILRGGGGYGLWTYRVLYDVVCEVDGAVDADLVLVQVQRHQTATHGAIGTTQPQAALQLQTTTTPTPREDSRDKPSVGEGWCRFEAL
jgi:hypothetical protein